MYVSTPCTAHSIHKHVYHTHGCTLISQLVVALGNSAVIAILPFTAMLILHVSCTARTSLLHAATLFWYG